MDVMESLEILWELNTPFGNLEKATAGGASASDRSGERRTPSIPSQSEKRKKLNPYTNKRNETPSPAHSSYIPLAEPIIPLSLKKKKAEPIITKLDTCCSAPRKTRKS